MNNQQDFQRIKALRLIDDEFMSVCFDNYIEGAELLLKVILDREDLKVSEVRTQKAIKNLQGRDVWLDIYAADKDGIKYNIEIQRADSGAHQKRARYHSSMVDADMLKPGESFNELRENYVIFITENDVLGLEMPIYHIERIITEGKVDFNDGEHIIYVNGSIKTKDTALGRLMNDFYCTEADDMCYEELSSRVKKYKESAEGVESMGSVFDEIREEARKEGRNEGRNENACEIALKLIGSGKLTLEEISEYSGLPIEKVRELAREKTA